MSSTNKRRSEDEANLCSVVEKLEHKPKKQRKSRWVEEINESDKEIYNGIPTTLPQGLTKEQEELILHQFKIEEITRRLRSGHLGIPENPRDRSPSPDPVFGYDGKRINTRESRTRRKLEEERHGFIQQVIQTNPDYKPPGDYRPIIDISQILLIPQDEHPEINLVGLLLGPRGQTLRQISNETGAKLVIRGKGSMKDGKVGREGRPLPAQDDPLHVYVAAKDRESVMKAVNKIKEIMEEGIRIPDGNNELRQQQFRQLAEMNGTLKESNALSKLKQLQEGQKIITNTILCSICGGAGHISQDCKEHKPGNITLPVQNSASNQKSFNDEYLSLIKELEHTNKSPNYSSETKSSANIPLGPPLGSHQPFLPSRVYQPWTKNNTLSDTSNYCGVPAPTPVTQDQPHYPSSGSSWTGGMSSHPAPTHTITPYVGSWQQTPPDASNVSFDGSMPFPPVNVNGSSYVAYPVNPYNHPAPSFPGVFSPWTQPQNWQQNYVPPQPLGTNVSFPYGLLPPPPPPPPEP